MFSEELQASVSYPLSLGAALPCQARPTRCTATAVLASATTTSMQMMSRTLIDRSIHARSSVFACYSVTYTQGCKTLVDSVFNSVVRWIDWLERTRLCRTLGVRCVRRHLRTLSISSALCELALRFPSNEPLLALRGERITGRPVSTVTSTARPRTSVSAFNTNIK